MGRRRALQIGFLVTAVAAVAVADLMADRLAVLAPWGPGAPFVAVGGRVVGGFAVGLAFRLQHTRKARPDRGFRLLVGLPSALLAVAPAVLAILPAPVPGPPAVLFALQRLAPFAGTVLGFALALAARSGRR